MAKYLGINVQECTKQDFIAAQKETVRIVARRENEGFLHSVGDKRTVYLHHEGKYYRGPMQSWQLQADYEVMEFRGIHISAVFRQKVGNKWAEMGKSPHEPITSIPIEKVKAGVR